VAVDISTAFVQRVHLNYHFRALESSVLRVYRSVAIRAFQRAG
jgi:hypothetical protein